MYKRRRINKKPIKYDETDNIQPLLLNPFDGVKFEETKNEIIIRYNVKPLKYIKEEVYINYKKNKHKGFIDFNDLIIINEFIKERLDE